MAVQLEGSPMDIEDVSKPTDSPTENWTCLTQNGTAQPQNQTNDCPTYSPEEKNTIQESAVPLPNTRTGSIFHHGPVSISCLAQVRAFLRSGRRFTCLFAEWKWPLDALNLWEENAFKYCFFFSTVQCLSHNSKQVCLPEHRKLVDEFRERHLPVVYLLLCTWGKDIKTLYVCCNTVPECSGMLLFYEIEIKSQQPFSLRCLRFDWIEEIAAIPQTRHRLNT